MDPALLYFNSSNTLEDDLNAYYYGLLSQQSSQQSSASSASAPYTNYGGLFTANGDSTCAETSFESDLLAGLTWNDYLFLTEGLLDGAPSFGTPGNTLGVSNINTSSVPSTFNLAARNAAFNTSGASSAFDAAAGSSLVNMPVGSPTFNFGAESADINMSVGFPTLNPAAGNTCIDMLGAPPTFDFTTGSANVNMPVGSQVFHLSAAEVTGINVPGGTQTTIEHPSYLEYGNRGFPNGTNAGDSMVNGAWVGTSQQVCQPINGIHAPLALPNTSLNASPNTSSETQSPPKRPNPPSARHTTPQRRRRRERAPSPAPPKRSRSSSPSARPPKRRREEPTIRFVHDERSMPANFRANPDNHGRFQYTATGRRKYLNGPGAVRERRRRREGNQGAGQQGNGGK